MGLGLKLETRPESTDQFFSRVMFLSQTLISLCRFVHVLSIPSFQDLLHRRIHTWRHCLTAGFMFGWCIWGEVWCSPKTLLTFKTWKATVAEFRVPTPTSSTGETSICGITSHMTAGKTSFFCGFSKVFFLRKSNFVLNFQHFFLYLS